MNEKYAYLSKLVKENSPYRILEIGTREGEGAIALATNTNIVITVDNLSEGVEFATKNKRPNIIRIICDSRRIGHIFPREWFDMIFIDGSHNYEDVKKDTEHAFQLIKKRGIIIWDDIYHEEVAPVIKELEEKGYGFEKVKFDYTEKAEIAWLQL